MEKLFIPYELALKLKELDFDEECFCTYFNSELSRNPSHSIDSKPIQKEPYTWKNSLVHNTVITAPLWQQAFDWFREEHKIDSHIEKVYDCYNISISKWVEESNEGNIDLTEGLAFKDFLNYEEARQACLEKLIEICKK